MRAHLSLPVILLTLGFSMAAASQGIPAGGNWQRVQAMPAGTKIHLSADTRSRTCRIAAVTEDSLTCRGTGKRNSFTRVEIRSVKLAHYVRSSFAGLGLGAGVGLVAGVAVAHGQQCGSTTTFCLDIVSNQDVWLASSALGGLLATAILGPADFTRGAAIYRRP